MINAVGARALVQQSDIVHKALLDRVLSMIRTEATQGRSILDLHSHLDKTFKIVKQEYRHPEFTPAQDRMVKELVALGFNAIIHSYVSDVSSLCHLDDDAPKTQYLLRVSW